MSLPADTDRLVINSLGGETRAAITIAKIIHERNITLIVDRYCISACAQFLLVAAKKVEIRDGALVLFHQSASAMKSVLEASGSFRFEEYSRLSRTELLFYEQFGADIGLLLGAFQAMDPICFIQEGALAEKFPGVVTRWGYSAVTPRTFKRLTRSEVKGTWVSEEKEIRQALQKVGLLGPASVVPGVDIQAGAFGRLPPVPVCPDQILNHPNLDRSQ